MKAIFSVFAMAPKVSTCESRRKKKYHNGWKRHRHCCFHGILAKVEWHIEWLQDFKKMAQLLQLYKATTRQNTIGKEKWRRREKVPYRNFLHDFCSLLDESLILLDLCQPLGQSRTFDLQIYLQKAQTTYKIYASGKAPMTISLLHLQAYQTRNPCHGLAGLLSVRTENLIFFSIFF